MAILKQKGKRWTEVAQLVGTKTERQCRTRALIIWNKLKRDNTDPELLQVLETPVRSEQSKNVQYQYLPDGTIKRDKNGKKVYKRPKRPYKYRPPKKTPPKETEPLNTDDTQSQKTNLPILKKLSKRE